jgi:hypothetical protein
MKLTSVLFSTPLPQHILAGDKTQTRRIIKKAPTTQINHRLIVCENGWNWQVDQPGIVSTMHRELFNPMPCPYGQSGDRLWVKETFYAWGYWEKRFNEKKSRDAWHFVDLTFKSGKSYRYADCPPEKVLSGKTGMVGWWKRPSIFMPYTACRIKLEITEVRVQRLQDISEDDAIAEGCVSTAVVNEAGDDYTGLYAHEHFYDLWDSIHGEGAWLKNPWVWCINFKVIEGDAK